jgi:multidrug efflux pump subunit AcrB/ABC-type multidrug transport system ATPase subunit
MFNCGKWRLLRRSTPRNDKIIMLEFILNRRTFISMLFIGASLLGYISYKNLQLELLPNVELPFLFVQVNSAREMDPEYLEKQAVIPIEGAIGTLEGIEKFESFVQRRQARIIVYYNSGTNIKYAYLKLQEKIDAIKASLPQEFFVLVLKIDTQQLSNMFMNLQIRGDGGVDRLRNLFDSEFRDEFEALDGIANVEVFGGHEKSVEIVLRKEISEAYNLKPNQIRNLIARNNRDKMFLGTINTYQKKTHVNLFAEYRSITDLENIVVNPDVPLLLKDVADVSYDIKEETSISRINGQEAVTVQLIRDTRNNLIELSQATREVIDGINQRYDPDDVQITIQQDTAEYLEDNLDLIRELALIGGLIAVVILWFFLRNLRLVTIIGLALPISVFTAFNLFYAFDITLNSLTLVGMALAIGMLLDNSIVVLENIYRIFRLKKDAKIAVIEGTKEVWRSIVAATITTIIVFTPFLFAENFMIRIIGYQIGVSIISTLVISLIVALMLIPMITYYMLQRTSPDQITSISVHGKLVQRYLLLLKSGMRNPLRTIISAVLLFFISLLTALGVSLSVQEENEADSVNLYLTMASGSTLESTDLAVQKLEERLKDIDEVEDLITQIYEEEAIITLDLKEDYESINGKSMADIKYYVDERIDDFGSADVSFDEPESSQRFRGGGGGEMGASFERLLGIGGQGEQLLIKGRDFEIMRRVADDIEYQLENLPTIRRVRSDASNNRPELQVILDKNLLNEYNITMSALASELNSFQQEVSTGIKYKDGTDEYDIMIMDEEEEEKDIDDLRNLLITSDGGGSYPLEQISHLLFTEGRSGINRVNQERQIEISYRFHSEVTESKTYLESARAEIDQMLASLEIPSGVVVENVAGESDLNDFYFLIAVAFILIYMVLASVFESLINPLIIMFTIPLAAIGSLWAIIFTESSLLNANTLIGFLILLGIVVNNGIILIDYTRILRNNGFRRSRALIVAGKARLRPITITAMTTIAAMIPLAMGKVEYVTTIAAPFAITVIGGLSLSTVFTLVLIPTVYSGLENLIVWMKSLALTTKLLQIILLILGCILIYLNVDSLVWQMADLFVLLLLIPGITYFVGHSLRQAKAEFISPDESLTISIQNLYKIYDQASNFLREWNKGKSFQSKTGIYNWRAFLTSSWQIMLLIFLIYYTYFYLSSGFWIFVMVHPVYFYLMYMYNRWITSAPFQNASGKFRIVKWIFARLPKFLFWGLPAINLIFFWISWQTIFTVFFVGFVWYFALIVYTTSNKLSRNLVNINRLTGRFLGLRKRFYRLIQIIPILGKKTKPFKALNGISLEIGKGMFGLLGPNGAGKTTLMRIICGVLEQSYGKIRINGIDVAEKREELQGLIGYLPQDFGTYENLTAYEFLSYQAMLKNLIDKSAREKRIDYVLKAVHMDTHRDEKIGSFSGGMKQRVGIAQTLLHLPRILVVDEPTAGLDPRERIRFRNLLVELSRERVVIFSTHIIEDVASSCDKVAVLNNGEIKYLGAPVQMAKRADNHVWQCLIDGQRFEEYNQKFKVIHHIKVDDKIRLRILSDQSPTDDAVQVKPTLEDSYLWLLGENSVGSR